MNATKTATISKRVATNIDGGLEITDSNGVLICVSSQDACLEHSPQTDSAEYVPACFIMTFHNGRMPAYHKAHHATLESLIMRMREIAPIRNWRISTGE